MVVIENNYSISDIIGQWSDNNCVEFIRAEKLLKITFPILKISIE